MAQSRFSRLRKLFSTDVIIRNVGGKQLKVIDINKIQTAANLSTNNQYDRYTRLFASTNPALVYGQGLIQQTYRIEMFRDYELMDTDPLIATALDVYSDESTTKSEFGEVLIIDSPNDEIKTVLHNLFYDILNIEFNLWPWVRSLTKYGDFFLFLHLVDKLGIVNIQPFSAYEITREETQDPDNPSSLKVNFKRDTSALVSTQMMGREKEEYENYEIAHFRLLTDVNYLPYGRSMVEPARKIWKQLTLMEDAMMLHRIMRAPERRVFKIDVGSIPPNEVDTYMEAIIAKIKKIPYVDETTGEYNLKFNVQNMLEDFYLPVRGDKSGSSIETLAGLQYDAITDVEYLKNKLLAALKIPKAFLGFDEALGGEGKSNLVTQDYRFARTIERIQRIIVSELYKIAIIHLYLQGYKDEDIVNFKLSLTSASFVYEQEKLDLWSKRVDLASSMLEKNIMSKKWIFKEIFHLSETDFNDMKTDIAQDKKDDFRYAQIGEEGNDPIKTGQSFGTPHDIAQLYRGSAGTPPGYDEEAPEGGWKGAGRPADASRYGKHDHILGYDPIGAKANRQLDSVKHNKKMLETIKLERSLKSQAVRKLFEEVENPDNTGLLSEKNIDGL